MVHLQKLWDIMIFEKFIELTKICRNIYLQISLSPSMFDNNFGKCGPIFKILPPGDL